MASRTASRRNHYIVVDTETTGRTVTRDFDPDATDVLLELGFVVCDAKTHKPIKLGVDPDGDPIHAFSSFVKPRRPVATPYNLKVYKFADQHGVDPKIALNNLIYYMKMCRVFVAHNAAYDIGILGAAAKAANMYGAFSKQLSSMRVACTMKKAAAVISDIKNDEADRKERVNLRGKIKLGEAFDYLKIRPRSEQEKKNEHTALYDAELCHGLFKFLFPGGCMDWELPKSTEMTNTYVAANAVAALEYFRDTFVGTPQERRKLRSQARCTVDPSLLADSHVETLDKATEKTRNWLIETKSVTETRISECEKILKLAQLNLDRERAFLAILEEADPSSMASMVKAKEKMIQLQSKQDATRQIPRGLDAFNEEEDDDWQSYDD